MVIREQWSSEKRDATPAQFRRLLSDHGQAAMANAKAAGRALARLMADAGVVITGVDDLQLERYRRRYAVAPGLVPIMFAVATGKVHEFFAADRAKALGRTRKRCELCAKHRCRCLVKKVTYVCQSWRCRRRTTEMAPVFGERRSKCPHCGQKVKIRKEGV